MKNVMKVISYVFKENNIQINVESWSGRDSKVLVEIPYVGYLSYK